MRTYRDAKTMAKSLRASLDARDVSLSHAETLEIVARQFGYDEWNVLAAKIAADGDDANAAEAGAGDDGAIRFDQRIPIMRIFDIAKAREFYLDFLGFSTDWEHRFHESAPLYTQISRAGLVLHLSEHHGDASPGSTVFVWMHGIEAFHAELMGKRYRYSRPGIEDAPWGRELQVPDPFGNRIRFCERK